MRQGRKTTHLPSPRLISTTTSRMVSITLVMVHIYLLLLPDLMRILVYYQQGRKASVQIKLWNTGYNKEYITCKKHL